MEGADVTFLAWVRNCAAGSGSSIPILSRRDIFLFWTRIAFTAWPWILSVKFCDTDRPSGDISEMSNFHAAEGMFHGAFHIEGHSRNQICFEPFPAVGENSSFLQIGCPKVFHAGIKQSYHNICPTSPSLFESLSLKTGSWVFSRWHLLGEGLNASLITTECQQ